MTYHFSSCLLWVLMLCVVRIGSCTWNFLIIISVSVLWCSLLLAFVLRFDCHQTKSCHLSGKSIFSKRMENSLVFCVVFFFWFALCFSSNHTSFDWANKLQIFCSCLLAAKIDYQSSSLYLVNDFNFWNHLFAKSKRVV